MLAFLFSRPLSMILGFVYPAYRSFKALETQQTDDDRQWLTYWVIMGLFSFVEYFGDAFLFWLPFYYEAKLAFILWLQLPQFQGARYLYDVHISPMLRTHEGAIDQKIANLGSVAKAIAKEATDRGMQVVQRAMKEGMNKALTMQTQSQQQAQQQQAQAQDVNRDPNAPASPNGKKGN